MLRDLLMDGDFTPYIPHTMHVFPITVRASLFCFLTDLQSICLQEGERWIRTFIASLVPECRDATMPMTVQRYYATFIGLQVLMVWPHEWHCFLLAYRFPSVPRYPAELHDVFGPLYAYFLEYWRADPALQPIYDTSVAFLAAHPMIPLSTVDCIALQRHPLYGSSFALMSLDTVAHLFDVAPPFLYKLLILWRLSRVYRDDQAQRFVRQSVVDVLRMRWNDLVSPEDTAVLLALPLHSVEVLLFRGKSVLLSAGEVLQWATVFWRNVQHVDTIAPDLVWIGHAPHAVTKRKYMITLTILSCIQHGSICASTASHDQDFRLLYLSTHALQEVIEQVQREQRDQTAMSRTRDQRHASSQIRHSRLAAAPETIAVHTIPDQYAVPMAAVDEWIRYGYLPTWNHGTRREQTMVCAVDDLHALIDNPPAVTLHQLASLWGILSTQAAVWIEQAILIPLEDTGDSQTMRFPVSWPDTAKSDALPLAAASASTDPVRPSDRCNLCPRTRRVAYHPRHCAAGTDCTPCRA